MVTSFFEKYKSDLNILLKKSEI